jgi:hypothetical protein
MGYCRDGWWLNQQFCCWEIEEDEEIACNSWKPWSDYTAARWMIYVSFAASCFPPNTGRTPRPVNTYTRTGYSSFYSLSLSSLPREICSWIRDLRDQVYSCRLRDAWFPWVFHFVRQIYHPCKLNIRLLMGRQLNGSAPCHRFRTLSWERRSICTYGVLHRQHRGGLLHAIFTE